MIIKETKSEKRERIRKNQGKMAVTGAGVKNLWRIKIIRAKEARGEKI